ncbi:uncharacterized protein [Cicer arietinum]|uniref:Uncharacterized protein LOC101514773 n=1 Tax=Cicer arietinum TaxID=3827 RepID=A0A1S2Z5I1_CICAR|nr:uncharacterized protein LOC101514773 [Cicer arietinum]
MQSERKRKLTGRNPLSDCTNTCSYSSSVPLKSTKPYRSSSALKKPHTEFTSTTGNLDGASNPNSPPSTFLSTPLPKTLSCRRTVDLEASEPISIVYSRRTSSNKRKDIGKEVVVPAHNTPIRRKDVAKEVVVSASSTSIRRKDKEKEVVNPVSSTPVRWKDKGKEVVIPASSTPIRWKDKGKEVVIPASSTPIQGKEVDIPSSSTTILKVSNTSEKNDGVEGANLPKVKAMTVPCRKKHRAKSSKQDVFKDPILQDYIEKQNAYFKMIDEFELSEEEVETVSDN